MAIRFYVSTSSSGLSVRTIILAVDGSPNAKKAADIAMLVAKNQDASLKVLAVNQVKREPTDIAGESEVLGQRGQNQKQDKGLVALEKAVEDTVEAAKRQGLKVDGKVFDTQGSVVEVILEYQESQKGDLIVLGTRGLGGFRRMLMGSVSSGVATHANCSVLVVR